MRKANNEQEEFLLLKIKLHNGVDFYSEHNSLIDKFGYVDFAKA
jgi:hypothetical protein